MQELSKKKKVKKTIKQTHDKKKTPKILKAPTFFLRTQKFSCNIRFPGGAKLSKKHIRDKVLKNIEN